MKIIRFKPKLKYEKKNIGEKTEKLIYEVKYNEA